MFGLFLIIGLFVFYCVSLCFDWYLDLQIKQDALDKVSNQDYVVYVNGQEVDADTVRIEGFRDVKVDDDNKYIIITVDGD